MMATFYPLDLTASFNATRDPAAWHRTVSGELPKLPAGDQKFWGVPFRLGPREGRGWLVLGEGATRDHPV